MPQLMLWIATVTPAETDMVEQFFKTYGPTGVITLLCVWLVTKHVPSLHKSHQAAISTLSDQFVAELKAERASRETTTKELREAISELRDCIKGGQL